LLVNLWTIFEYGLDGAIGRALREKARWTLRALLAAHAVGFPSLAMWLIYQIANGELHEITPLLSQIFSHLPHSKIPTRIPQVP
jgi:hypothetical protein